MSKPDDKTLARMQKLLALAQRGVGGEAANAQRFLETALAKHGMTMADIDGTDQQVRSRVVFPYGTTLERKLTLQIAAKVLDTSNFSVWSRKGERSVAVDMTPAERAEVVMHLAALVPAMDRHMERAFNAFVQSNALYASPTDETDKSGGMSVEELALLDKMVRASERVQVNKALPGAESKGA